MPHRMSGYPRFMGELDWDITTPAGFIGPWCQTCCLPRHDWRLYVALPSQPESGYSPCRLCGDTEAQWSERTS